MGRFLDLTKLLGRSREEIIPQMTPEADNSIRLRLESQSDDAKPRSLISALGDVPDNVGEMIESVAAACRAAGEFPVAVLTLLRPEIISMASMPIEFIPTREYIPIAPEAFDRYVRRRWSLIIAKWDVSKQIDLASGFEAFLAGELRASTINSAADQSYIRQI